MNKTLPFFRLLAILLVAALAWNLRSYAALHLPVDYDEDDYLRAAQEYAAVFRSGDLGRLTEYNYRPEHPPLAKMLYGLNLLTVPEFALLPDRSTNAEPDKFLPYPQKRAARAVGVVLGTLTAALLALLNPAGGFFLAIHALTIKYTSQIMLEGLPALTSLAAVFTYTRFKHDDRPGWLIASGALLGLTAASKYLYALVGIAILLDWLIATPKDRASLARFLRLALPWGILALVVFFAADPYLWPAPLERLKSSILYHAGYATSSVDVQQADLPVYQPLVWIFLFSVGQWHPDVFSYVMDPLIALIACFGLPRLWKREPVYVLWLAIGLAFLLAWPTKWPQYVVTLTAPLSLAAGEAVWAFGASLLADWKTARAEKLNRPPERSSLRLALPWLIPGALFFAILTLYPLLYQFAMSLTDFNLRSILDGMRGGVWRAVSAGLLSGQAASPADDRLVHYIGAASYMPILDYITTSGLLGFNLLWTGLSVGLQAALGIGASLLLWNQRVAMRRGWQAFFVLPWAIPETIGAIMWFNVLSSGTGWLALAAQKYGPGIPFSFLLGWESNPGATLLILLIISLWYGFPIMMLAASAGLKLIPAEVSDAAAMDGASNWQSFRYIYWPLLFPLLIPAIIIRGIFAFNQFYLFQISHMFGNYSLTTLATLSYNLFNPSSGGFGRSAGQFAISAGLNILTMIILMVFVALFNRWSKAGAGVTYA
jgi:multiple sugar transport system permease protein